MKIYVRYICTAKYIQDDMPQICKIPIFMSDMAI